MIKIGIGGIALTMLSACGNGTPDYDATGTFEATEVIVSAEVAGKLLNLDIEEGKRLQTGEEIGLVDTLQLYLKKLQLEANMKSVESQRPDLAKQIAATKQQIATAEREKKRVENLLTAGAANQKQLDDWDAQVKLLERQLAAQESSLLNSTNSLTEQGNSVAIQVAQVKDQLNGFGWKRLPKSFMAENTVFLLLTALIRNFYRHLISDANMKSFGLKRTSRIKTFVFKYVSVPAKWIKTARQHILNIYTSNDAYMMAFKFDFG